jgi:hypothetical protein
MQTSRAVRVLGEILNQNVKNHISRVFSPKQQSQEVTGLMFHHIVPIYTYVRGFVRGWMCVCGRQSRPKQVKINLNYTYT